MPAGQYTVGDRLDLAARIVPDELARYLVETGQGAVTLIRVEDTLASPVEETEVPSPPSETGEVSTESLEDTPPTDPDDDAADEDWPWERAYLDSLTPKKLRDLANRYGISMPSETVKKADLIELLLNSALPDDEIE
jgi:hypothetical protein